MRCIVTLILLLSWTAPQDSVTDHRDMRDGSENVVDDGLSAALNLDSAVSDSTYEFVGSYTANVSNVRLTAQHHSIPEPGVLALLGLGLTGLGLSRWWIRRHQACTRG